MVLKMISGHKCWIIVVFCRQNMPLVKICHSREDDIPGCPSLWSAFQWSALAPDVSPDD